MAMLQRYNSDSRDGGRQLRLDNVVWRNDRLVHLCGLEAWAEAPALVAIAATLPDTARL
jgi:hypothetical protein